jgi:hypothetical protein
MSQEKINELRIMLRQADKLAQSGDVQAQADAQKIFDQINHLEGQLKTESSQEFPPIIAGGLGEAALLTGKAAQVINQFKNIPQTVKDVATNQKTQNEVLADLIKQNQMMQNRGVTTPNADVNWTKSMTGISPTGSQMTKESLKQAQSMTGAIGPGGPAAGGSISASGNVIVPPDLKAERQAAMELRNAQIAQQLKQNSLLGRLGKGASILGDLGGRALSKANPYLQAFSMPYEATEAYNKFNRGDNVGGALSTIGAGAGAASLYPPLTIPMGALSLGAHGADWTYQEYLKRRGQPQQGNEQQPAQYAIGGLVFSR